MCKQYYRRMLFLLLDSCWKARDGIESYANCIVFNLDTIRCTYEYESQCDKKYIGDIQTCKIHLS